MTVSRDFGDLQTAFKTDIAKGPTTPAATHQTPVKKKGSLLFGRKKYNFGPLELKSDILRGSEIRNVI